MNKEEQLLEILENNKNIRLILERANKLKVPNWYLGAGGIAQTVWNALYDFDLETGIKDYDEEKDESILTQEVISLNNWLEEEFEISNKEVINKYEKLVDYWLNHKNE